MTIAALGEMSGSSPVSIGELSANKVVNVAPVTVKELEIDLTFASAGSTGSRWEDFFDFLAMGQRG